MLVVSLQITMRGSGKAPYANIHDRIIKLQFLSVCSALGNMYRSRRGAANNCGGLYGSGRLLFYYSMPLFRSPLTSSGNHPTGRPRVHRPSYFYSLYSLPHCKRLPKRSLRPPSLLQLLSIGQLSHFLPPPHLALSVGC